MLIHEVYSTASELQIGRGMARCMHDYAIEFVSVIEASKFIIIEVKS
jgi:hypothetical protein